MVPISLLGIASCDAHFFDVSISVLNSREGQSPSRCRSSYSLVSRCKAHPLVSWDGRRLACHQRRNFPSASVPSGFNTHRDLCPCIEIFTQESRYPIPRHDEPRRSMAWKLTSSLSDFVAGALSVSERRFPNRFHLRETGTWRKHRVVEAREGVHVKLASNVWRRRGALL